MKLGNQFFFWMIEISGKRHFAPTFHYDLPEEMFVTISRHIKTYMIFGMTNI
jgi:hypothetical protein